MAFSKPDPSRTVLTISVGFLVLFLAFHLEWAKWAALIIGLAGTFSNYLARKIDFVWLKMSYLLSLVVPNILLAIIYFLVLFPVAFLSRLFRKNDPLFLTKNPGSTFINSNKTFHQASFEKPW